MAVTKAFVLLFLVLQANYFVNCVIKNRNVERTLDLSSQLVKETIKIVAEDTETPIKEYVFVLPEEEAKSAVFILAKDDAGKTLKVREENKQGKQNYVISFQTVLPVQALTVELVAVNKIVPYPREIQQSENQLVKYNGWLYYFSEYQTQTQTTTIKLSSTNIVSNSQVKPFSVTSNKIKYGPYENIAKLSTEPLTVHYQNDNPFLTVKRLERTIEVSHWGNIAVTEHIFLEHTGAKLKGSFSRYEFQKGGNSGQAAVKSYTTILPSSATGVDYRDTNGNISTSAMNILKDAIELELRPRFPLFGGWKTQYTLKYNVPSFEYLYNSDNKFLLKMRVVDHIFDNMLIEDTLVKVILPEGSTNIELVTPYAVKRHADELHFTYLDTVGRPVIVFSQTNLIEQHIQDFSVKYSFSKISLLQEPILVISSIFIIFVTIIIFLRLDFSIQVNQQKE